MSTCRIAVCGMLLSCFVPEATIAQDGHAILSEASVYRGFVQWMKPVTITNGAAKECPVWGNIERNSEPPPTGWVKPEFNDSSWFHWREPRVAQNLAGTEIRRYDLDQYGFFRSTWTGLLCLRGRFMVSDPAKTGDMKLLVEFRGGLVAYMNGKEVGRSFMPKAGEINPDTLADEYPEEAFTMSTNGAPWKHGLSAVPKDADGLKRVNTRIRKAELAIPASSLLKGSNILALEIHRSPKFREKGFELSECGLVSLKLVGGAGATPAVDRPKGLQVWNVSSLARVTPFGGAMVGRIWAGGEVSIRGYPLSWGPHGEPLSAIQLVAPRNGVCAGQVVVGSDAAIKGLVASAEGFKQVGGKGTIPASSVEILYGAIPAHWPVDLGRDESATMMDALMEKPPAEVPAIAGKTESEREIGRGGAQQTWVDSGAIAPVWVRVRVPGDCPAGEYSGTLGIKTAAGELAKVPLRLRVADWTAPKPRDFQGLTGAIHSPDTVAAQYKAPIWSDKHFELMERSLRYAGEIGGRVAYVPLIAGAEWFHNEQGMVYWVKKDDGGHKYDFRVFDKYLDMVQKHLKIEVVCLYVADFGGMLRSKVGASVLGPDGKVSLLQLPEYKPTPEAVAFWKPVVSEALDRLNKRGLGSNVVMGLIWEQPGPGKCADTIELFKQVWPEMKLAQIAHYGGQKGGFGGVAFGHVMSVWGNCTPQKSKIYGARDLSVKLIWHPRADGVYDVRPIAAQGAMLCIAEQATVGCMGFGPVGMDFWNLPGRGCMEGAGAWNLSMSINTAAALLAPGPDGPVTTSRYELFREGVQECEARYLIEKAMADPAGKAKLGDELLKKCKEVLDERRLAASFVSAGQRMAQGEGWRWFEGSDWETRTFKLFTCAGEVSKALAGR